MGNGVRVDRAIRAVRPITTSTIWRTPIVINATAASSTVRRSRKFADPGMFGSGWSMYARSEIIIEGRTLLEEMFHSHRTKGTHVVSTASFPGLPATPIKCSNESVPDYCCHCQA